MDIAELPDWYLPPDGYLWDPWFYSIGATIHLFHLFQRAPQGLSREESFARNRPTIEHATWSSSQGWAHKGTAIGYTGQPYDELRIHTGCVVEHEGSFVMLYSGSNRFVCLARSDDLDKWIKSSENPVAFPDPAIYMDRWRDPWVFGASLSEKYTMVVAAQQNHVSGAIGTVAVAHSADLRRWQQDKPLQVPDWFEWMEVPEIHYISGIWYLLFVTRQKWITARGAEALRARGLQTSDGAYCMTADSWRGPYESIQFLSEQVPYAYTTRLLRRSSQEYWLWSHVERDGEGHTVFGLRPPTSCTPVPGGGLLITEVSAPAAESGS